QKLNALPVVEYEPERVRRLNEEIQRLGEGHERFLRARSTAERLPEIEQRLGAASKLMEEREEAMKQTGAELDSLGFDPSTLQAKESQRDLLQRRGDALSSEIATLRERLRGSERYVSSLERDLARLRKEEAIVEELGERLIYMSRLEELLAEFRAYMISRVRPALSAMTSEYLDALSNGRYTTVEIGKSYEIMVDDDGALHPLERFSGGEIDLVSLCLRLAISRLVAERSGREGMGIIILDEVFGSQDSERRRAILEALAALSNQFRQVFLITHIEEVRDHLSHLITVRIRDDGTSEARLGG
ncbi:MAG: SbcC/MukB-like Walker B domain-containing protein, partial [Candidatus Thermoplasmatota archaeon]